jgi:hypothetical protein
LHAQILTMERLASATDALLLSVERFLQKPGTAFRPNDFRDLAAAIVRCTRNWGGPGWRDACEALAAADAKITDELRHGDMSANSELGRRLTVQNLDIALWSHRIAMELNGLETMSSTSDGARGAE